MAAFDPETEKQIKASADVTKSVAPNIKALESDSSALFTNYSQPPAVGKTLDQKIENAIERSGKDADRFSELITKDNFNR